MYACMCVRVHVRVCVYACIRTHVHVCCAHWGLIVSSLCLPCLVSYTGSYLSQKLHHFETLHVQDMIRSDINHVSKNHHCSLQFTALGR